MNPEEKAHAMGWLKQSHEKSLFGQLLVKHGVISDEQLAKAIEHQRKTGQRLGDIFAEWNVITQHHVQQVLRKQRNLRLAAAIAAVLLGPLRAFAAGPLPPTPIATEISAPAAAQAEHGSLRIMTEDDLERISAQGLTDDLIDRATRRGTRNSGVQVLGDMAVLLNPLLGFLEADTTIKDMMVDPANASMSIGKDGSITLKMASTIGELNFQNIRIRGTEGPSFGSIRIRDIDLTGTTVVLKHLP
jgi:hypothetical protein